MLNGVQVVLLICITKYFFRVKISLRHCLPRLRWCTEVQLFDQPFVLWLPEGIYGFLVRLLYWATPTPHGFHWDTDMFSSTNAKLQTCLWTFQRMEHLWIVWTIVQYHFTSSSGINNLHTCIHWSCSDMDIDSDRLLPGDPKFSVSIASSNSSFSRT